VTGWLITGVGSGLGQALARAALARGDSVAGTVRRQSALAAFEALAPGRAFGLVADMSDEASVKAAAAAAGAALGGVDILVNNAGYGIAGAIEETSLAEARAQFEVNVLGPMAAIQAVLPAMRARRAGHIINISSVSGLAVWSGTGVYCASKHALEAIGQTLADEVAPFGIKVTNAEPGGMRTDYAGRSLVIAERRIADYDGGAHESQRLMREHVGQEAGDPARMAAAILSIAGRPDAPLQLLLGADAVHYATAAMARFQEEFGRFASLSLSTAFEA
jgi:NAD(P)-dependent dehydrogenase (short-subunit alcohol dehydrogenase family)